MSIAGITDADRKLFSTLSKERESQRAAEKEKVTLEKETIANAEAKKQRLSFRESNRIERSGKAKNFVTRTAGSTLKYPRDLFTNSTDYLSFDFYEFGPYLQNPNGNGIQGSKLGSILTYMPSNVRTQYGAKWGESTLSPSGRVVMNALNQAAEGASRDSISGYLNKNLLDGAGKTVAAGLFAKAINATGSSGVNANSLIGMSQGVGINNTVELFWSGHGGQRRTNITIAMAPKSKSEAREIENIIKTFKVAMHPSKNSSSAADVGGRFVSYPLAVQLRYMHKSRENERLNKFKPMVIENVAATYTPDNQYVVHDDGTPVSYVMQINLKEIKLLYADDIIGSQGAGF